MSNLPQQNTINQYLADGSTDTYVYSFLILLDTDLSVYVTPSGQAPDPSADIQVLNVDYTVTGEENPTGGNVVFSSIPPISSIVTIVRTIQASIVTNFQLAQTINGQTLDDAFERVTLVSQQTVSLFNDRALQYVTNDYLPNQNSNLVPSLENGQVWSGLNGAIVATTIENDVDVSLLRSQLASELPLADGASLVGYYDPTSLSQTTVSKFLNYSSVFGIDTGSADALVLTIPNSEFSYKNGQRVQIIASHDNTTTTPTLNVNSLGPIVIKRDTTSSCQAGDILTGFTIDLTYYNGNFLITNLFVIPSTLTQPTVQIFDTAGSGTYTTPAGVSYLIVEIGGAGGGSGGVPVVGSSFVALAGGGGAGGYVKHKIDSPAPSYSYDVGAAGTAGAAGTNNGGDGGDTTFHTLTASGGKGGVSSGAVNLAIAAGGDGGDATGGNILNSKGGSGQTAVGRFSAGIWTGASGGSNQLCNVTGARTTNGAGIDANNNCGGAAGAYNPPSSASAYAGGAGGDGLIIVWEYYQ